MTETKTEETEGIAYSVMGREVGEQDEGMSLKELGIEERKEETR